MDSQRFDALTRAFAAPSSRRRVLRALVGGALAVTALGRRPLVANVQGSPTCDPDPCGGGGFVCCSNSTGGFSGCCLGSGCCGLTDADQTCCTNGTVCNATTGKCVAPPPPCAEGTTPCGIACCTAAQTCGVDGLCAATLPPPPPPPPDCTICPICEGGTFCNGECCAPGVGCDAGGSCAVPCDNPLISCQKTCVLPCPPNTVRNPETCACVSTVKPKPVCPKGTKACRGKCCASGERCVKGTCKR